MKIITTLALLVCLNFNGWSQMTEFDVAEPTPENKELIDQLMKISRFEEYFIQFCSKKIDEKGKELKWTTEDIAIRKSKINFSEFMSYTVYNAFAASTKSELEDSIQLIKKISRKKYDSFFISSPMIQSNLDLFVTRYLE